MEVSSQNLPLRHRKLGWLTGLSDSRHKTFTDLLKPVNAVTVILFSNNLLQTDILRHSVHYNTFTKCIKFTAAGFMAAREIERRGKLLTDGENIKELFITISQHLSSDLYIMFTIFKILGCSYMLFLFQLFYLFSLDISPAYVWMNSMHVQMSLYYFLFFSV